MLTPRQLRAARALLDWSREELAAKSGVFANTIKNFESGTSDNKLSTVHKLRLALSAADVEFLEPTEDKGEGVRFKGAKAKR